MTWIMLLNDMRDPKIEIIRPVARAETKESLETWERSLRCPEYRDGQWLKSHVKGSPLEWFNPPFGAYTQNMGTEQTTMDRAVASAKSQWQQVLEIPEVGT